MSGTLNVGGLLGLAALGVALWSFSEYALHAWAFHKSKIRWGMVREHIQHHSKPEYFAPTKYKVLIVGLALAVLVPVLSLIAYWPYGGALVAGYFGGYAAYEVVHRRLHTHAPRGAYGRWARRHHFFHHFGDPRVNHGVTSPIWDHVFGTYRKPEMVRVPKRLGPVWLFDDAGSIHKRYLGEYVLMSTRRLET